MVELATIFIRPHDIACKMKKTILLLFALACCAFTQGQRLKDVNVHYMVRSILEVGSTVKDMQAPGGFASSDNLPKPIPAHFKAASRAVTLRIDTTAKIALFGKYNGYRLYLANTTDELVGFDASDSQIELLAEVYIDSSWKLIEYRPSSWCGNSYHKVYLGAREYWQFKIPKYSGEVPVLLRYRLPMGDRKFIYSNTIHASINRAQLSLKQGHSPTDLMDPHED